MHALTVLDWEYYHNSVRAWVTALGILLGVFVALALVRQLIRRRLAEAPLHTQEPPTGVNALAGDLVRRTRFFFLFALGLAAGSLDLTLAPRIESGIRDFAILAALLQVAIWGDGLIGFGLQQYVARRSTPSTDGDGAAATSRTTVAALGALARAILWILLVLIALDSLGVRVTTLIAGLGVTGIALALAVQNILGDVFAALSIVMDKPFVVGDAITVDTMSGTVEHIGLKTTRVRATTGEQIVFSNADLLKSRIRNFRRLHERTVTMTLLFDPASAADALAAVPEVLRGIIQRQEGLRFGRSHVTPPTLNGIGVETVYTVLTPDYTRFMDAQQAITVALLRHLGEGGARLATTGNLTVVYDPPGARSVPRSPAPA